MIVILIVADVNILKDVMESILKGLNGLYSMDLRRRRSGDNGYLLGLSYMQRMW
jgi:hypothetical protein